jgi:quercetin dioxygenase-like cupin family protein
MSPAPHYSWSSLTIDTPMALLSRKRIMGEKMMISEITLFPGCTVPVHHHENEQFSVVLRGHLRFTVHDASGTPSTVDVKGGEVLHLPSNVPHGVVALEETLVLDLFSPPSETTGIDRSAQS